MAAESQKPRFEPPPWEREAFDRFQQERAKSRAAEELDEQLRRVRQPEPAQPVAETPAPPVDQHTVVPEAKIDSMLIQLRAEEPSVATVNKPVVNAVIVFLAIAGIAIIVMSALLFRDVRTVDPASKMLGATMSLAVLFTGLGFLGGAFLLFRKYHR